MGEMRGAAKTQYLYARALERVTPSYHPGARVTVPRLQQPIMDDGRTRTQLLDPKGASGVPSGKKKPKRRGPKLAGSLRERIVLRSWLPDSLKMECLERLDKMEKERAEKMAEQRGDGGLAARMSQRRRSVCQPPPISGGFYEGQRVMARSDLYLEGDNILAAFMDKAVVLGPSRSSDPSRVCVRFEERRDGGTMWVNVLPDEIMSEENGLLMQKYIEIGKARIRRPPPTPELQEPPQPPEPIDSDSFSKTSALELRIIPWTSSAKGGQKWHSTARREKRPSMRDSHSLPALLGGLKPFMTA